jgi:hypothetical protein
MFKSYSCPEKIRHAFFQPNPEYFSPVLEGIFDYNSAFAAFLKSTDQKKQTALMVGTFVSQLQKKKVLFDRKEIIKVADLGCADSSTCLGYLNQMEYSAGFDYLGFDINDKFLEEAQIILSRSTVIKKYELIKNDVLSGELSTHPSVQPQSMDLIFVSHLAYYLRDEEYGKQFVKDILSLLNDKGIAVFLHEDSTYYFRSMYNTNYINSSAPFLLKSSVSDLLKTPGQFNEMSFTSKLRFAEMSEELWQAAKSPSQYKKFAHIPSFIDNLNKFSFIVQCDLAKLAVKGSLERFINEMKVKLENNNYSFNLITRMQVLVNPQNTYTEEINRTLREIENDSNLIFSTIDTPFSSLNTHNEFPSICYS